MQDVAGWERFVAGLLLRPDLSVFVTGSNAKMLSRELGTKLTGRHLDLRLTPFDYAEFLAFTKSKNTVRAFDDYLATGGFPAFVRTRNRQILSANFGHKLENVVYNYLKQRGGDVSYFLDAHDCECDFVRRDENGRVEAVQVCWELTDDNERREFAGLVSALKYFGLKRGVVVTHARNDLAVFDGCEIEIVAANEYLTR